ncbi:MAG: prephenate dehydrogenase [Bacteroidales bacterium]|nr:MAG: prephenate dehydrogenase [Bacteroidales bacterium]
MINKILIVGAGNMGAWLVEALCLDYEVGVYDVNMHRLKFFFNTHRFIKPEDIKDFAPQIMINAASLQHTIEAFETIIPYLPADCIISDIASVKNGLFSYYKSKGMRFVSTHPMFGPTFANIKDLAEQNVIIITESDKQGAKFFRELYGSFNMNIHEYSFQEHDQTIAYSLSIPFTSSLVFASCMIRQDAPGTTFKKHLNIARGLLSENNYLLSEILFNPYTIEQVENIKIQMEKLIEIIKHRDTKEMHSFFDVLRKNIK